MREAIEKVWEVWDESNWPDLYVVATDESANALRLEVDGSKLDTLTALGDHLSAIVDVPTYVVEGHPVVNEVCTSRTNCYSPMKAGIKIY